MAPRTSERGKVIPVRDLEREAAASANGPVITYKLSPEELEKYRAGTKPPMHPISGQKEKKPVGVPDKGAMNMTMTKEQYLEQRLTGKNRSLVIKESGINTPAFYGLLDKWGIREMAKEEELLGNMRNTSSDEQNGTQNRSENEVDTKTPSESSGGENDRLKAELEQVKAANVEAVLMAGKVAEKHLAEIDRLKDDNDVLSRDLTNLENELAEVVNQRDALRIANDTIKADYEQMAADLAAAKASAMVLYNRGDQPQTGYLTLRIPIIEGTGDRFTMADKVHEELEEVGAEIEAANIDRRRCASELYDLVQSFAGLIRAELSDLVVNGSVDALLQEFFDHHNQAHVEKIQRYAAERGWRMLA